MDILYISPQSINEITRYCKKELVISVINHFAQNGKSSWGLTIYNYLN